jgi:hypothetical protein
MLRDLHGAWSASKLATTFEPSGDEANEIRRAIYEQERVTGVRVIPEEDRAKIDSAMGVANALEGIFQALDN